MVLLFPYFIKYFNELGYGDITEKINYKFTTNREEHHELCDMIQLYFNKNEYIYDYEYDYDYDI